MLFDRVRWLAEISSGSPHSLERSWKCGILQRPNDIRNRENRNGAGRDGGAEPGRLEHRGLLHHEEEIDAPKGIVARLA